VGSDASKEVHIVHKHLICFHSRFFDAAFNNTNLLETQTQRIDLPDIDPPTFGVFVNWLYLQKLEGTITGVELSYGQLILMLSMAKRFEVPTLQAEILNALASQEPRDESDLEIFLSLIYQEDDEDSALKRQAIDITLRFITENNVGEVEASIPEGMRVELMKEMLARYAEIPKEERKAAKSSVMLRRAESDGA
jgi:hypothetical protein